MIALASRAWAGRSLAANLGGGPCSDASFLSTDVAARLPSGAAVCFGDQTKKESQVGKPTRPEEGGSCTRCRWNGNSPYDTYWIRVRKRLSEGATRLLLSSAAMGLCAAVVFPCGAPEKPARVSVAWWSA